jgi:integrase
MIKLRYKPLKSGKYSLYLDCYSKDMSGNKKREYIFLGKQVEKNYGKTKKIISADKETMMWAEETRRKKELQVFGKISGIEIQAAPKKVYLGAYLEKHYQKTGLPTSKSTAYNVMQFTASKDILINEVTPDWLEAFKNYLNGRMSNNGARNYLKKLKARLNGAVREGIIAKNPFEYYELPPQQDVKVVFLEEHEIKALVATPFPEHPKIRQAFLFSCFTGLRISDLRALTWGMFRKQILKDGSSGLFLDIKPIKTSSTTGKKITVPLSVPAKKLLNIVKKNLKATPTTELYVFDNLPHERYCRDMLKLWSARAGIKKNVHFHVGRHTFATMCLSCGMDIYSVSNLLGHTTVITTEGYAKIIDDKKRNEIKKLPKL